MSSTLCGKAANNSTSPAAGGKGLNKGKGRRPAHQQGAEGTINKGPKAPSTLFICSTIHLFN